MRPVLQKLPAACKPRIHTLCKAVFPALVSGLLALPAGAEIRSDNCLISPIRSADVSAAVAGLISATYVNAGDLVSQGDPLAELENASEKASVAIARNDAEDTSALDVVKRLAEAEKDRLDRARALHERSLLSDDRLKEMELAYIQREIEQTETEAQLRRAQLQLDLAEAQLQSHTISAPFDGVIIDQFLEAGEFASSSAPVFRIVQLEKLRVEVVLRQQENEDLQRIQRATVFPDLAPNTSIAAERILIDPLIDAASGTVRVRLDIDNSDGRILSGQRCRAILSQ